jgi:polar amino acid transport system substrate-binding protein
MLQLIVTCPEAVNKDMFGEHSDGLALTILRNFCRDISINGNTIRMVIK